MFIEIGPYGGGIYFLMETRSFIRSTSFVYDDEHILYRDIDKDGNAVDDRCIVKRKMDLCSSWFGYGIYDENGDRL